MGFSLMTDLYRVVNLYRQFPKFDKYTYSDLVKMITPSLNLDQYQIHKVGNEDIGFTNWAYLSDTVEQRFKLTGKLKPNEWNCGKNIWHIETVAKSHLRQIMKWTKEYFRGKLDVNQSIKLLRIKDHNIYRRSEKYKREFHIHL